MAVEVIDQTRLPHEFVIGALATLEEAAEAIATMLVRGAPLIGATAAYGIALAMRADASDAGLDARLDACSAHAADRGQPALGARRACARRAATLPRRRSARRRLRGGGRDLPTRTSRAAARIGEHGAALIRELAARKQPAEPVNILTHCNAGWLATVDWGTALRRSTWRTTPASRSMSGSTRRGRATRAPRSPPGSSARTACRTRVIADNAGGHLMQHGQVDLASSAPTARPRAATSATRSAPT